MKVRDDQHLMMLCAFEVRGAEQHGACLALQMVAVEYTVVVECVVDVECMVAAFGQPDVVPMIAVAAAG